MQRYNPAPSSRVRAVVEQAVRQAPSRGAAELLPCQAPLPTLPRFSPVMAPSVPYAYDNEAAIEAVRRRYRTACERLGPGSIT